MSSKPLHLCFVGHMLGQNTGFIRTQGQITADLFASDGYEVVSVSGKINRIHRLAEISSVLIKNRHRFDLVSLEVYSGLSFILADVASLLCKILKLPLIMVLHGGGLPEFIQKNERWAHRVLKRADCFVAPSRFLARKIGNFGFEVNVVPNVIELDLYPFRQRAELSPRLLWMRSFHSIYNPEMAIKVLAELKKSYPYATLTMAGIDKGLEADTKKLAVEMNLSDAVTFPGFLDANQKLQVFSESDIYLNTNRIDNMPVAVVEACAFGLPVVATNVGGLSSLISHGENGLLVETENVNEMAETIKRLLSDSQLVHKLSAGGRRLAEQSAWTNVRAEWERLFGEVMQKKSKNSTSRFSGNEFKTEGQKS